MNKKFSMGCYQCTLPQQAGPSCKKFAGTDKGLTVEWLMPPRNILDAFILETKSPDFLSGIVLSHLTWCSWDAPHQRCWQIQHNTTHCWCCQRRFVRKLASTPQRWLKHWVALSKYLMQFWGFWSVDCPGWLGGMTGLCRGRGAIPNLGAKSGFPTKANHLKGQGHQLIQP